ncbi:MAG: hypothetical protein IJW19_08195 [Clostridia bacterium]|nr:hypothetical protein [Clostridia bacterium]
MEIKATTVYDKSRLIRFNHFISLQKKAFWIFMSVATLGIMGYYTYFTLTYGFYLKMLMACSLIVVFDVACVILHIAMPYFTVKKSRSLDARVEYTFCDEALLTYAKTKYEEENNRTKYSAIKKAVRRGGELYLFLESNQAFLVDISTLSSNDADAIKEILSRHIDEKKIKW